MKTKVLSLSAAATNNIPTAREVVQRLAEAMMNGNLDERGNVADYTGADAEIISQVNGMLDALVAPLRLAASAIDEIAHGRIPPFLIDDYKGEFNDIKRNLNTLLATLYGMHSETQNLIGNIREGRLRTRGNDWDFEGIWRELIGGVNGTLDAVTDPLREASTVLERLADYDLSARMHGSYHGEHAVIKKAMNSTAEALHSAISHVVDTVELVSNVGNRITQSSQTVSQGATEQSLQLSETSASLDHISETSVKSAQNTHDAQIHSQRATESITTAKEAMNRMLESMSEIRSSADNTAVIVQEIDTIAKSTDTLSSSAANKAMRVRTSAGGFGVVASEIRKLSKRCAEAVEKLGDFSRRVQFSPNKDNGETLEQLKEEFQYIVEDVDDVAMLSNLLGVNAAIEAAHVEGAGNDFEVLTDEIRQLAQRSTDAAKRTETLIQASVALAQKGAGISQEIDEHLATAVEGARSILTLTDEISQVSQEQASGLEQISQTVSKINEVTRLNATSALESSDAASDLAQQVKKLATMVNKFRLDAAA